MRSLRTFVKLESSGGIVLVCAALVALIIDNTPWRSYYSLLFHAPITATFGGVTLTGSLTFWINEGLMTIFFLLVGLEMKRELQQGELSSLSQALLPAIAALGGMLVPALFYIACTYHDPIALRGWAIPVATDIAFSLGVLSVLGSRIPLSAKVFLTALAIFDDLGAIIIIALFYTSHISLFMLSVALLLIFILVLFNYYSITRLTPYLLVGIVLWAVVLQSGVHATLAGVIVALVIPAQCTRHLEQKLHPFVAFGVLPLFGLANAGVSFAGMPLMHLFSAVPLAIVGGLFIGKQLGVWGATFLAVRCGLAKLPKGMTGSMLYGLSLLAGIGFTMSLFIANLAFDQSNTQLMVYTRCGVLVGSVLSGIVGYFVLRRVYK